MSSWGCGSYEIQAVPSDRLHIDGWPDRGDHTQGGRRSYDRLAQVSVYVRYVGSALHRFVRQEMGQRGFASIGSSEQKNDARIRSDVFVKPEPRIRDLKLEGVHFDPAPTFP